MLSPYLSECSEVVLQPDVIVRDFHDINKAHAAFNQHQFNLIECGFYLYSWIARHSAIQRHSIESCQEDQITNLDSR